MPYLEIHAISKQFGAHLALAPTTLSFSRGEFVSILGPSGCGKTTLLSILSGISMPTTGSLHLEGRDITLVPPEHRNFGMVFQNYALFPNLTVRENIVYGLHAHTWSHAERTARADELMEITRLAPFARYYPAALSGGQQQRVALARALAPRPALLLLDEPLSALDAQVRITLGQELLRIQRQTEVTTIMVTHDQQEALALADRIILMHQGEVEQVGTPETLYNAPNNRFVAEFIGHMNIISLPAINNGAETGIRYEDVLVHTPSEQALAAPHTWVARVEHKALMGAFYRLELLFNDFVTRVFADVPYTNAPTPLDEGTLLAVTLPQGSWRSWQE